MNVWESLRALRRWYEEVGDDTENKVRGSRLSDDTENERQGRRGVVGSTLAFRFIFREFEAENRLFSHRASVFSKLKSLA